jgi:hypothetical protein
LLHTSLQGTKKKLSLIAAPSCEVDAGLEGLAAWGDVEELYGGGLIDGCDGGIMVVGTGM